MSEQTARPLPVGMPNIVGMARVDDVAAAIIEQTGSIDVYKFQKLAYYCQAWHLVWDSAPLFKARIEAWANGPVIPALYKNHRREYRVDDWPWGDSSGLTDSERETVAAVLDVYGDKSGAWLSELTHRERPWREARKGLLPGERGQREIKLEAMLEYYGGLVGVEDDEDADDSDG